LDIKAYIASGILEHYVLGLVSEEEAKQVERYAREYPEIRQELDAIEAALADFAQGDAIKMPAGLTDKVMTRIDAEAADAPAHQKAPAAPSKGNSSRTLIWVLAAIAAGLAIGLLFLNSRLSNVQQNLQQQQDQLAQLQTDCDEKDTEIQSLQRQVQVMRTPGNRQIFMLGTDNAPTAIASVHYNPEDQKAYLDIIDMEAAPTDKQYQLWAIVDGQPVDMGVFDVAIGPDTFQEVPYIENAQAFAVTVENAGGSPMPSLETLVVIGNVG
jgi:anti-sigma-K factor RskA